MFPLLVCKRCSTGLVCHICPNTRNTKQEILPREYQEYQSKGNQKVKGRPKGVEFYSLCTRLHRVLLKDAVVISQFQSADDNLNQQTTSRISRRTMMIRSSLNPLRHLALDTLFLSYTMSLTKILKPFLGNRFCFYQFSTTVVQSYSEAKG